MMTLYVVRHGNTENNSKGKTQGQIDTPLTDEGLEDASLLAAKLERISFDHVYSSDLGRAFITAHIIVEKLGMEQKLTRARSLREINYGIYANMESDKVKKICPEFKKNISFVFPEGESFAQMYNRIVQFISLLEKKHMNRTILVVTHSGPIRTLISLFKKSDFAMCLKIPIPHNYVGQFVFENKKPVSYKVLE